MCVRASYVAEIDPFCIYAAWDTDSHEKIIGKINSKRGPWDCLTEYNEGSVWVRLEYSDQGPLFHGPQPGRFSINRFRIDSVVIPEWARQNSSFLETVLYNATLETHDLRIEFQDKFSANHTNNKKQEIEKLVYEPTVWRKSLYEELFRDPAESEQYNIKLNEVIELIESECYTPGGKYYPKEISRKRKNINARYLQMYKKKEKEFIAEFTRIMLQNGITTV